jgi:hypothetical protein
MTDFHACAREPPTCIGLKQGISGYLKCAREKNCRKIDLPKRIAAAKKARAKKAAATPKAKKAAATPKAKKVKATPKAKKVKATPKAKKPIGIVTKNEPNRSERQYHRLSLEKRVRRGSDPLQSFTEDQKLFYLWEKWNDQKRDDAVKFIRADAVKFVKAGAPQKKTGERDFKKTPIKVFLKSLGYEKEDIDKYLNSQKGDLLLQYGRGIN